MTNAEQSKVKDLELKIDELYEKHLEDEERNARLSCRAEGSRVAMESVCKDLGRALAREEFLKQELYKAREIAKNYGQLLRDSRAAIAELKNDIVRLKARHEEETMDMRNHLAYYEDDAAQRRHEAEERARKRQAKKDAEASKA